jgi:hypothetical protein
LDKPAFEDRDFEECYRRYADAAKIAFANMRAAFAGEADRLGIKDEKDIVAIVDEVREEMWEERYADRN